MPGIALFEKGEIPRVRLELSDDAIKRLRTSPREYVVGTVVEGARRYTNVSIRLKGGPGSSTFYLLSAQPSLLHPFDPYFGALPVYSYDGVFFVDDSQVGDLQLQQNGFGGEMTLGSLPGPGGGGGTNSGSLTNICTGLTSFTVTYQLLDEQYASLWNK